MRRLKSTKASPQFIIRGQSLSNAARVKILELLGYGKLDLLEDTVTRQLPGKKVQRRVPHGPILLVDAPKTKNSRAQYDVGKIILTIETTLGIYIDGARI